VIVLDKAKLFELLAHSAPEGLVITNQNDKILFINDSARVILSIGERAEMCLYDYLGTDEQFTFDTVTKFAYCNKVLQVRLKCCDIKQSIVKLWYIADITEQEEKDKRLECLDSIVDAINEGVIASDSEGRIMLYNKRLEDLEGRLREEVLGKHITEVYDVIPEESEQVTALKTGKPTIDVNLNYVTNNKEMHIVSSTYPIKAGNKTVAVFSISRDITMIRQLLLRTIELQEKRLVKTGGKTLNNGTSYSFSDIVGSSTAIQNTIKESQKTAINPSPVLIFGETGTGKELFVQSIHNAGPNKDELFVAINCAAIPESLLESMLFGTVKGAFTGAQGTIGLFEQAGKGTLYLDEVNSMAVTLQAKTLRVLQEKKIRRVGASSEIDIHCRIMSSTNVDPWQCVEKGILRKDLYYRLAVIQIELPPLRQRPEDVQVLSEYFLKKYARVYGKHQVSISDELQGVLQQHTWPGNVRELEHILQNSLAMLDDEEQLTIKKMPHHLLARINKNIGKKVNSRLVTLAEVLLDAEKETILHALKLHNWNVSHAAKQIGIGRQNLQYRMTKLNIKRPDYKDHQ
jgi:arginine utilization regulatory protein